MKLFEKGEETRFDRVHFAGDETRPAGDWTQAEFERLPLVDRIRMLAGGTLRFFRGDKEISSREACTRA